MTGKVNPIAEKTFANLLKDLMDQQGMGPAALEVATGVDHRLIRKYLAGTVVPHYKGGAPSRNAHKLARALDVPVTDLIPPSSGEREAA